jgi:type I restriction enzyme S subunit
MSFPRYEKYKDSGVEWLGEVPAHWEVISIKWLSPVLRGASPRPIDDSKYFDDDGEYSWVRIADVSASDVILKETTQKLSDLGSSLSVKILPGQLFVSIAGTVGKPCISEIKACIHDGFVYFPKLKINPKLLYRIFESGTCYGGLGKWGTQLNLNTDTIGSIRVAFPPDNELNQILAFLDRETAKIDELIAEQQRLVELLKEKRQAVISHAVTKGLNPDAPMKDSGIEWLGEVPVHWGLNKLKHFTSFSGGGTPSRDNPKYWNGDIPWISPKDMKLEKLSNSEECITEAGLENSSSSLLSPGRVLMVVRSGILKHTIPVAINDVPVALNQDMKALDFTEGLCLSIFFLRWVQGLNDVLLLAWAKQGATVESIEQPYLAETVVPLPSIAEQNTIIEFLDQETTKIDKLIAEAQRAIELLKERRTALISAAVTGKIDVRGLVADKRTV